MGLFNIDVRLTDAWPVYDSAYLKLSIVRYQVDQGSPEYYAGVAAYETCVV